MSINGQGHSLTLVKGHSDFKVKCLNLGLYTQVSDSGPLGPLVIFRATYIKRLLFVLSFLVCNVTLRHFYNEVFCCYCTIFKATIPMKFNALNDLLSK